MLRDLQPQRRQAQRERQPERQQMESGLPVRWRPKVSHFSPASAGEFCFASWLCQPPSIFPVSSRGNDKLM